MIKVDPKQKIIILVMLLVFAIGGFAFYKMSIFSGDDKKDIPGSAKISNSPSTKDIKRHTPGTKETISKDSPLYEVYEQERQQKLDEARNSEKSYLDTLDFGGDNDNEYPNSSPEPNASNDKSDKDSFFGSFENNRNKKTDTTDSRSDYEAMIAKQIADQQAEAEKARAEEARRQQELAKAKLRHEKEMAALAYAETERARMADFVNAEMQEILKDSHKRDDFKKDIDKETEPGGIAVLGFNSAKRAASGTGTASQANSASSSEAGWRSRLSGDINEAKQRLHQAQIASSGQDASGLSEAGARVATRNPYAVDTKNASNSPGFPSYAATKNDENLVSHRINAGNRYFSTLDMAINTDVTQHVTVTIHEEGPLKNAKLLGEVEQSNESAKIVLHNLSLDGRDYAIKAIVLDHNAKYGVVADKVDTHFFERWGALTIASLVEGYATSVQGYTTERTGDTTVERRESVTDDKEQIAVAVGNVGRRAAPIIEENFDREATVYVDVNKPITVFFLQSFDVFE